ncbi:ATP-binding cassette domain-containing protein [Mucilaginibacter pallidiroseus]|uniref:ATP-binding cassette domain-containing protein n=1 Tax=Mucilaginibacter pallidiroseus TaxID=2599295 RepID=A0A563UEI6_9SPHI|nr:ATP-binding cassette domain-containing protein [Mucilaginibacter pallidiroseus]TWR29768.1 ATP-binding cassette domain-containing protein [Mucilaginibacter pallidiroseus]
MIKADIKKQLKDGQLLHINKAFVTGSITRVTGPSGAGKTTFLKMLAGLIKPDEGLISVDSNEWFNSAGSINLTPQLRKAGFVFQDYALFPNMTVMQHLKYACGDNDWIDDLLKIGGLDSFTDKKPLHLSGGQQQRLAILRALAIKPNVLLMDEPFSAIDVKTKMKLLADLQTLLRDMNTTVIAVTHNPQELDGIATDELIIGED